MAVYEDYTDYTIRAWLQEPIHLPEDGRADVARRIRETRQQRHWWPAVPAPTSQTMFSATRLVIASVVLAIVAGTLYLGVIGPDPSDPATLPAALPEGGTPSASPGLSAEPQASPSPFVSASPAVAQAPARQMLTRTLIAFPDGTDPTELVRSVDGFDYYLDRSTETVWMVDRDGYAIETIHKGWRGDWDASDGPTLGSPRRLTVGDSVLLAMDDAGVLWGWDQRYPDEPYAMNAWPGQSEDIRNLADGPSLPIVTTMTQASEARRRPETYDLFVTRPETGQITRHRMQSQWGDFQAAEDMLDAPQPAVAHASDLYADPDLYVLAEGHVRRFRDGGADPDFELQMPAGPVDLRYLDGVGTREAGRLYVYDAFGERILEFAKADGTLLAQWVTEPNGPSMTDVRGLVAVPDGVGESGSIAWMTAAGIFESQLGTVATSSLDDAAWRDPATQAAIAMNQRTISTLQGRLDALRAKAKRTKDDRSEIERLKSQLARLKGESKSLRGEAVGPTPRSGVGKGSSIDWRHKAARLQADRLEITTNGLTFRGVKVPAEISWGDDFEIEWRDEHERWMRLRFTFGSDATHWWISEIATYDGRRNGSYVYYDRLEPVTRTLRGEVLTMDLLLTPDRGERPQLAESASLRIDGMRLTAFMPGTEPAPLEVTGCRPVVEADGVMVEVADELGMQGEPGGTVVGLDYYGEGALLEGIDELPIAEASERLTELGICHEFEWASDLIGDPDRIRGHFGYGERWCTVPPVVQQREYEATRPRGVTARGIVSRFPFSTTREGYVKIYVEDEQPRSRRQQPPAGWNCPTY